MRSIHIPGVGKIGIGQVIGGIASVITFVGVIIAAITGGAGGSSAAIDEPTAPVAAATVASTATAPTVVAPTASSAPASVTASTQPSTTTAPTSATSVTPTSTKPRPVPSTPTSTQRPAPTTPTTSAAPPRPTTSATPARPAVPTTTTSQHSESDYGPGQARPWREWFSLDDDQMQRDADLLGRNIGAFHRQGGSIPLDELAAYAAGQANGFQEITFDESVDDADLYAFTDYVDQSGAAPILVHVERVSIPLAMISEHNPWLWGALKAPDQKGLNYGTAVRFDDNYFYVFTALRKVG